MSQITILDGRKTASEIKQDIKSEINKLSHNPRIGIILVGKDQASEIYVKSKIRSCEEVGIDAILVNLPSDISESQLLTQIDSFNNDSKIDGFIVQLPLPKHISKEKVIKRIDPDKDIDGFHTSNIGKMTLNLPTMLPATPYGIVELLRNYNIDLEGKNCTVIGRSNIVGLPLSIMLGHDDQCTVTSCHVNTNNLKQHTRNADIVVVAVGQPNFLTEDMVKEDAIVIDVGINRVGGKVVGDVDFENVAPKASYITPVPGGVGPMTIVSLLRNAVNAVKNKKEYES